MWLTTMFLLTTQFINRSNSINPPSLLDCFLKNVRERIKLNVLLREETKSFFFTTKKNGSPSHFSNNSYDFFFVSKLEGLSMLKKFIE